MAFLTPQLGGNEREVATSERAANVAAYSLKMYTESMSPIWPPRWDPYAVDLRKREE